MVSHQPDKIFILNDWAGAQMGDNLFPSTHKLALFFQLGAVTTMFIVNAVLNIAPSM